ncbi:hypothetical protein EKO04_005189 [Ascochyta lentis]|uniref:Xaa-Pro dipeptidyl-peptidase C-terminal domain-containing protein n=1 Tax=Ascochyta lentis TaxID=205686 RepID=A0A8H7J7B4_9PLEO|nr:hypothetical protein EKO04_005189 [Ascochyta lentis]
MPTTRSFTTTLIDRLAAHHLGFPPETTSYTTTPLRIPIATQSGQLELAADLYQPVSLPQNQNPLGTILIRSPYGRTTIFSLLSARPYAARGYTCLLVSSRGTFSSTGIFEPWRNEEEDGQAVVQWMRAQGWYTGTFATLGGSYLGFAQWAVLTSPPQDMVAAVVQCAPHDFAAQLWGAGALAGEWVAWAENVLAQEETGGLQIFRKLGTLERITAVLEQVALADSVKAHFRGRAPWIEFVVDHPDISDSFYDQFRLGEALERAETPIFLVSGWYDVFAAQTMEQYTRLRERGVKVALLVGPWNHMQVGLQSSVYQQSFSWLEEHLGKRKQEARKAAVQYFVTGAEEWRYAEKWPPPTSTQPLYLAPNNLLTNDPPSPEKTSSTFTFNPRQPTPTVGGNLLLSGGSKDDTSLTSRHDVLTFTTAVLKTAIEIAGKVTVQLHHSSTTPTADLFLRLSEVNAKGRSHNITETYRRLDAGRGEEGVVLHLNDCAHRFQKGTRIRLVVAGASFPQYAIPQGGGGDGGSVVHTVFHGSELVSKVVLPVV